MTLFRQYLAFRWKLPAAYLLFGCIFALVFAMYRLPLAAVAYPAALCALFGALFLTADFLAVRRRHRELERIAGLSAALIEQLPPPHTVEDGDYQAIIHALQREAAAMQTASATRYQDMVDYYTIWAHQIKTPIASMRLTLQNEDTAISRQLQGDLFRIEQYVELVLAFLRLDSESTDYVFRSCQLDDLIRSTVKKFSHEFIQRKIRLDYTPTELSLVTDEKWLCLVLEQILSNALKYTRQGSIRIYMADSKTLCIQDTGIGIAPEDLPRIFEKGYTGYNGRADRKASGIGLYLCRRICRNLGIGITAESTLDTGTTISLHLEQYPLKAE